MDDLELAVLSSDIYNTSTGWTNYWEHDNIVVGHKKIGDIDVLALRGTKSPMDCMRDADFLPTWHPQLGWCYAGFMQDMLAVLKETRSAVGRKLVITGHSLGGARARLLAGLYITSNLPVVDLCVFGSPRPAFPKLASIIANSGIGHRSYRNASDLIPNAVVRIWPVLNYVHTEDWKQLNAPATSFGYINDHHIDLYIKGLQLLTA